MVLNIINGVRDWDFLGVLNQKRKASTPLFWSYVKSLPIFFILQKNKKKKLQYTIHISKIPQVSLIEHMNTTW